MELPEIVILSRQMDAALKGKTIAKVEINNPKSLNIPPIDFTKKVTGRKMRMVEPRGKWIFIHLDDGLMLLYNTGMGADALYFQDESQTPEKYHQKFVFNDGTGFTVRVYWFSYLHLVQEDKLNEHKLTAGMGLSPLDSRFTLNYFKELLDGKKTGIKSLLTNQHLVARIGNVYIHDPLFLAGVHPQRKASTLTEDEVEKLYYTIG